MSIKKSCCNPCFVHTKHKYVSICEEIKKKVGEILHHYITGTVHVNLKNGENHRGKRTC
jgi:hypothetical protein